MQQDRQPRVINRKYLQHVVRREEEVRQRSRPLVAPRLQLLSPVALRLRLQAPRQPSREHERERYPHKEEHEAGIVHAESHLRLSPSPGGVQVDVRRVG